MPYKRNPADVAAGIDASKTTYDPKTGREATITTTSGVTKKITYSPTGSGGRIVPTYEETGVVQTPQGGVSTAFPESYQQTQQQELINKEIVQQNILQQNILQQKYQEQQEATRRAAEQQQMSTAFKEESKPVSAKQFEKVKKVTPYLQKYYEFANPKVQKISQSPEYKIVKGGVEYAKENPFEVGIIAVVGVAAGLATGGISTLFLSSTATAGVATELFTVAAPVLTAVYVGEKSLEFGQAPSYEEKGVVLTKTGAEVGGFIVGSGLGSGAVELVKTKTPQFIDTIKLRYRQTKITGKLQLGKIPLEVKYPTTEYKPGKGEYIFGSQGEIVGRQLTLSEPDYATSTLFSEQAKYTPPKLGTEKIPKAPSPETTGEFLGKWLPRPLSPKEVASIQRLENQPQELVKFQTEFFRDLGITKISAGEKVFEITPTGRKKLTDWGSLKITGELISPEEKFPIKQNNIIEFLKGPFSDKKGQLIMERPEIIKEDVWEKFEPDYYIKSSGPKIKPFEAKTTTERSNEILLFSMIPKLSPGQAEEIIPMSKQKIEPLVKPLVISSSDQAILQEPAVAQIPQLKKAVKTTQKEVPIMLTEQRLVPEEKVSEIIKTTPKEKLKISETLTPPPIPILKPRKEPLGPGNKQSYQVLVRRGGIFSPIAEVSDLRKAFNLGRLKVASTAAASFKIVPSGKQQPITDFGRGLLPRNVFYESRREPGVFIQRREKRISSPGEKKEITFKGIFAEKAKRSKFNWRL